MKVLLTRPEGQSKKLCRLLDQFHIEYVLFPTIKIVATKNQSEIFKLCHDLNQYDFIIFVSPSAIHHMRSYIDTVSDKTVIVCTGKDTAQLISDLHWGKAIYPREQFGRKPLLALRELQSIAYKKVLLCRGDDDNQEIESVLRHRKAEVMVANVYHREIPIPSVLPELNNIDVIQCTSMKSMKHLLTLLGDVVLSKLLLVSSENLQAYAKNLGFIEKPLLAKNAGDEAILHTLIQFLTERTD